MNDVTDLTGDARLFWELCRYWHDPLPVEFWPGNPALREVSLLENVERK